MMEGEREEEEVEETCRGREAERRRGKRRGKAKMGGEGRKE